MPRSALTHAMSEARHNREAMNRIISKAAWLILDGRVIRISDIMYYVMGRKNRHIVRVDGGKLVCTCEGFKERGICSHVVAVSTVMWLSSGYEYLDEWVRARVERELKLLGRQPIR
ncbi:MAG: hypothetical protein DRJ57_05220 [Thermoprotei archaeon]|nr:MAG: hypothetical protein DRJ57_05220 [Thermoprotei archaeon]